MTIQETVHRHDGNTEQTGHALRLLLLSWGGVLDIIIGQLLESRIERDERAQILRAAGVSTEDIIGVFVAGLLRGTTGDTRSRLICNFGGKLFLLGFDNPACVVTSATKAGLTDKEAQGLVECMIAAPAE